MKKMSIFDVSNSLNKNIERLSEIANEIRSDNPDAAGILEQAVMNVAAANTNIQEYLEILMRH